jgi:hypothetical protein
MHIVGLTGESGVGKTTFAGELALKGWVRCSFALPLRAYVYSVYDLDVDRWGNKEYEHTELTHGLGRGCTPQQLLLREGAGERATDPWVWVRYAATMLWRVPIYERVVFDDVRQANEALFIRNLGGTLLHLRRGYIERAPQPLDTDLQLLGGKNLHLDYLPARKLANSTCPTGSTGPTVTAATRNEPVKNYLEQFVPSAVLSDDAVGLMNYKFLQLNPNIL